LKRKCDNCNKSATHHSVEIIKGAKIEKHLCDECAEEEGLSLGVKATNTPINELLTNFVKLHSGSSTESSSSQSNELSCEACGLTFSEFRENSLMGCRDCYNAFESQLSSLLERAHEGATHHIGKVPDRAGEGADRQHRLTQLNNNLDNAVVAEDYELAAKLSNEIQRFEEDQG
jgi:protein arginine kinase activator